MTTTITSPKARWMAAALAAVTALPLLIGGASAAASASESESEQPSTVDVAVSASDPSAEPAAAVETPAETPAEASPGTASEAEPPAERTVVPTPTATSTNDPDPQSPLTLTISAPELEDWPWYDTAITAGVSASSRIGSTTTVVWSTSGAQVGSGESAGHASIPITASGITVLTVSAHDDEGNGIGPVTRTFKVDTTAPVMTLRAPSRPVYRLGDSVVLDYDCQDPESGMNGCFANIVDNYSRPDGETYVFEELGTFEASAYGSNNAGGFSRSPAHSFRVIEDEDDAPTVEVQTPASTGGWWNGPITVGLLGQDGDGSGVKYIEYRTFDDGVPGPWISPHGTYTTFVTAGEGDNRYQVRAVDWFDNVGFAETVSFPTDTTAPVVTSSIPAAGVTVEPGDELNLDFDCSDALSGLAVCEAPVAAGEALDTDELGTFEVVVRGVDKAGNETRVVRSYTVAEADVVGPVVSFTTPAAEASGWFFLAPDVTVTAVDPAAVSLIEWDIVSPTGGITSGSSTDVTQLVVPGYAFVDGTSTVRVRAVDMFGNATTAEFVVRIDGIAPVVTIDSPQTIEEFEQGEAVPFEFSCTDAGSGIVTCASTVGAVLPTDVLGDVQVTVSAVDAAGQSTVLELAYTVVAAPEPGPGTGSGGGGTTSAGSASGGSAALPHTGADVLGIALFALCLLVGGGVAIGSRSLIRRGR